jgi:hypothetical protein
VALIWRVIAAPNNQFERPVSQLRRSDLAAEKLTVTTGGSGSIPGIDRIWQQAAKSGSCAFNPSRPKAAIRPMR